MKRQKTGGKGPPPISGHRPQPRFAESPGGNGTNVSPTAEAVGEKRVEDDQKAPAGATHGTQRSHVNFAGFLFLLPVIRGWLQREPLGQEEHTLYRSSPYDRASLIADF